MAMAPTAAAAPMPAPDAMPSAGMDAAPDDMAHEGAEPNVLFTVMGPPEGPYTLMAGDEPEGEGDMAADAPTFDTPQALMKAIMELLNNSDGAENSFAKGFKGEPDDTAMKPPMKPPMKAPPGAM